MECHNKCDSLLNLIVHRKIIEKNLSINITLQFIGIFSYLLLRLSEVVNKMSEGVFPEDKPAKVSIIFVPSAIFLQYYYDMGSD